MTWKHRLFAAAAVAASASSSATWAQEPAPVTSASGQVEEIVVTARRIEENVQDVPVAVTDWDAEVAIFGKNLAQQEYYVRATSLERALGYNVVQIGDPRTYGIQIKKRFGGI